MRQFIKDWKELDTIPKESKTHTLEVSVKGGCGWLKPKVEKPYNPKKSFMRQIQNIEIYLSTHAFYGRTHKHSSKMLRACGFDVELDNWDKVREQADYITTTVNFCFTGDNEQLAIEEIELAVKNAGFELRGDVKVIKSSPACRNAYGKQLTKEEFDKIDTDSDSSWFEDYDFELQADVRISSKENTIEDLAKIDYFDEINS